MCNNNTPFCSTNLAVHFQQPPDTTHWRAHCRDRTRARHQRVIAQFEYTITTHLFAQRLLQCAFISHQLFRVIPQMHNFNATFPNRLASLIQLLSSKCTCLSIHSSIFEVNTTFQLSIPTVIYLHLQALRHK